MSQAAQTKVQGRVVRLTFQNPENGYAVARVQPPDGGELVTVVGRMPGLSEGQEVEITGRAILHPRFGPQVEVESFAQRPPSDSEGLRRYLASGLIKGVGPVLAQRMVDHLGPQALERISQDPSCLAQVPGIGVKRARIIAQSLAAHAELNEVMVFLQGHGVGPATGLRIFRRYGAGTLGVLQSEPHRLAQDIEGIGFATADRIAARMGLAPDHPSRLEAGLIYTLRQAMDEGHVYLPQDELLEAAADTLGMEAASLEQPLSQLEARGRLSSQGPPDARLIYLTGMYKLEERAGQGLARLSQAPGLLSPERAAKAVSWVSGELAVKPSPSQAQALRGLLAAGLGVLTGGPGTGKTTLVRALVTIARRMEASTLLAAPTGRAAKRLSEACGLPAFTLHRLLEYSPQENRFNRNSQRPLEARLVVVDESSMIDTWLMAHLVEAIGQGSALILVGDADQLPSVGPGLVFRQVMESGAAQVARLSQIYRQDQAGLIVANAHRVLAGQMPELPGWETGQDFIFLSQPDPARAAQAIRDLVCDRLPKRYGLEPMEQIQVLAPMHRGTLGCQHLNSLLRQRLNPAADQAGALRPGDKVMQVRNNYELEVFNGDLGLIMDINPEGARVMISERQVSYSRADMDDLVLAYAVTVHKSQGCEYPAVVLALGGEHFVMLNRPLLYTALTRAQRVMVVVGSQRALARAVQHDQPVKRYANLAQRIAAGISPLKHGDS